MRRSSSPSTWATRGDSARHDVDGDALVGRCPRHAFRDVVSERQEVDRPRLELDPPGLQCGQLEHVVDEPEESLATVADDVDIAPLLD